MTIELADIRRLLDAFERSDWDQIHLVTDGVEVHIAADGVAVGDLGAAAVPMAAATPAPATTDEESTPVESAPAGVEDIQMDGAHAVISPSPGIFWRSPAPGEPPFADVGQAVAPDTPIGIVEVMKLMNQVLAGVEGTVRAVLVENGARVERDEPIVLIDPAS